MSALSALSGSSLQALSAQADGDEAALLKDFSVADDGTITGVFSSGVQKTLGQIALATFDNEEGLIDTGGNNYRLGPASGEPIISAPGDGSNGILRGGSLEGSNVDLAKEFTDMITTSTAFSANSRVISTGDRLLTELLNTSR